MTRFLLILAAILLAPMAQAADNPDWVIMKDGAPVTIRPDRAYILYRTVRTGEVPPGMEVIFLRDPGQSEVDAYWAARATAYEAAKAKRERERRAALKKREDGVAGVTVPPPFSEADFTFRYDGAPNLMRVNNGNQFFKDETESVYLIEVRPSTYVIAGAAHKIFINTLTCMCMGTVRFEAKPGVVTDLGTIIIDDVAKVSTFPELVSLTGRGARINGMIALMVLAVRPYAEGMTVPAPLQALARVPADFRAVGKFPNTFAASVNRMAPMPGVLAYDEDRVIDVKAQTAR